MQTTPADPIPAGRTPSGPLLDALDGIAYVVDIDGTIMDYSHPNWDSFAVENDAPEIAFVGRRLNILSACEGDEVRNSVQHILDSLWNGRLPHHRYSYRCDSASIRRELRMHASAMIDGGKVLGVLFHSLLIDQYVRPPIDLLDPAVRRRLLGDGPLISMCSYCLRVRRSREEAWMDPETYYAKGGVSSVKISHGICEMCYADVVVPTLV